MNIEPEQLPRHLSRQLAPLYVVHGEEVLLAIEAGDRIRAAALAQG
jgi:DNA polymerase-3 subunit delta